MNKKMFGDFLGWGLALWFIGYILGFIFFMFLPKALLGWAIMPIGIFLTIVVLAKKIAAKSFSYYVKLGVVWMLIAILFDYFFIVKLLSSPDYYKPDVYIYYLLTFLIPVLYGILKKKNEE